MKTLKLTTIVMVLFVSLANGQDTKTNNSEATDTKSEIKDVMDVMKSYKDALQNLTSEGTIELFSEDSKIYESGGVEGTYRNYLEHHLGPELGHFESFTFSDYKIEVEIDLPYAFTTETYVYTIVLKPGENGQKRTIRKKGVATAILRLSEGNWRIIKNHSSSRNVK